MRNWTDADDDAILQLLSEGETRKQIAAHFGVTRNAICGRVHRMTKEPLTPNAETIAAIAEGDAGGGEVFRGTTEDAFSAILASPDEADQSAPESTASQNNAEGEPVVTQDHAGADTQPAPRIEVWTEVGPRGNEGELRPGGWRITEEGRLNIHCRCGTNFLASEETGCRDGEAGYCVGCGQRIFASQYWDLWKAGQTNRPIQWMSSTQAARHLR